MNRKWFRAICLMTSHCSDYTSNIKQIDWNDSCECWTSFKLSIDFVWNCVLLFVDSSHNSHYWSIDWVTSQLKQLERTPGGLKTSLFPATRCASETDLQENRKFMACGWRINKVRWKWEVPDSSVEDAVIPQHTGNLLENFVLNIVNTVEHSNNVTLVLLQNKPFAYVPHKRFSANQRATHIKIVWVIKILYDINGIF